MSSRKSFLLATTLLTTVLSMMTIQAQAGSGSIAYQMDYVSRFGSAGSGNGQFNLAQQMTLGPDGNLYIGDGQNNRFQVFDKNGTYLTQFGTLGTGNGQYDYAWGVAFGSDGKMITSDFSGTQTLQVLDPTTYAYISRFGNGSGNGPGQFHASSNIVVNSAGDIYVVDRLGGKVVIFDSSYNYVSEITGLGSPHGIAIASDGRIYVADDSLGTVSVYDSSNNYLGVLAPRGSNPDQIDGSEGVATDSRGNVYVTSYLNNNIQVFDKNGNYILTYDSSTSPYGSFGSPNDLLVDNGTGKIYVNEYTGNVVDILQLTSTETFNGSPPGGNEIAATPLANLVLNGPGTFADDFIGYHNVDLAGNWTLSGNSSFSGLFNVNSGTLVNDGTLSIDMGFSYGAVTNNATINIDSYLQSYSTLINNGTINGYLINFNTLLSPGIINGALLNIGTIDASNPTSVTRITGNYFDDYIDYPNSVTINVKVNDAGQASKIIIGGTATIAGGHVIVNAATGTYHVNNSYVILTATGGVSGTFDTVTSDLAFLTPALDYSDPNQITLTLTRNDGVDPFQTAVDFAPYAASGNQQAAAVALSAYSASAFEGDTATFDAVQSLSVADAGKLLNEVSPDQVAAMPAVQTAMITSMQTPMFQRLQSAPVSSSDKSGFGFITPDNNSSGISPDQVWLQTIGGVSNQDNSSNGAAGYRLGTVGVRGGADKDIDDKTKLGISAAYAHGTANYKGSNDSSQTQYAHADLYGRHELGTKQTNLVLEGFLGAGGGRIDSTRYITAGTLNNTIIGNTNAYDVSGAVKLSNPIRITNKDIITPNITTAASWTRQNGYTETGSPFALQMNSITSTPVTVTPMVNWQHTIKDEKHGFNLTPDLGIGATWQLSELNNNVNANFANSTTAPSFTTQSAKQDPLSLNLSAAVTMQPFTSNKYVPSLTAQATAQTNSNTTNTTATLTAKWDW